MRPPTVSGKIRRPNREDPRRRLRPSLRLSLQLQPHNLQQYKHQTQRLLHSCPQLAWQDPEQTAVPIVAAIEAVEDIVGQGVVLLVPQRAQDHQRHPEISRVRLLHPPSRSCKWTICMFTLLH